jgi:DNA polymerase-3 subunit gamma/tau
MENFIVSARKYRPETFDAVVGQPTITSTLKNAIKGNHLGHAYLFCGPRGVGKTTCARIFAKTINCSNITQEMEPCNECESCISFNESRAFNIHELDAASNNSVDDIRNLTDQVRIPPQVGKYSIYIIDEVHMLSAQAFNAFLKTLEEPPPHAIFILATTEKHKIIPTILSRCQIFDFNRIRVDDIVAYLEYISKQEGIDYEADAFNIIALKADGAMRDALSIFDQIVSFSGESIRYEDVIKNLNILDYEYYFRITNACLGEKVGEALMIFNEILEKGFDEHHFLTGLSSHMRDLLVCLDPVTWQLLEVGAGIRDKYQEQSKLTSQEWLYQALDILGTADVSFRASRNQRLHIELALVKLCNLSTGSKKKVLTGDRAADTTATRDGTHAAGGADTAGRSNDAGGPDIPGGTGTPGAIEKDSENKASDVKESTAVTQAFQGTEMGGRTEMAGGIDPAGPDPHIPERQPGTDQSKGNVPVQPRRRGPANVPSIRNALNGTGKPLDDKSKGHDPAIRQVLSEPFTQDALLEQWNAYAHRIRDEKPRMSSSLKNHLPSLGDALQIEVTFSNSSQIEEFNRDIKQDLVSYLEEALQNTQFKIIPVLQEEEHNENLLYTAEEKYDHMIKKNPNLGKLKERFNLDFE